MNGLPYYKAYPRDFFEGTIGMTVELKGIYRLVLDLIYMQGGKLLDDPRYIAGMLGCSVKAWNSARAKLIEAKKIDVSGEFLTNNRAILELEILGRFQEKQRKNGSEPKKNKDLAQAMASPPRVNTEPDTEKKETNVSLQKAPRRRPEVPLPDGWVPSERNIADAIARNFTSQEIDRHAEQFRNHHTARGTRFRDWDAAWRTWLGNAHRFGPPAASRSSVGGGHSSLFAGFQRAASGFN